MGTPHNRAMNLTLPAALQGLFIFGALATIAAMAIVFFLAYLVIKAAVRDGIKESGLVDALRRQRLNDDRAKALPPMTVD